MKWIETSYDGELKRVALADRPVKVGRSAECDFSFPDDKQVSRFHAVLEERPNGWFVVDNKSTNGSYVNGQRVTVPFPIKDGDVIEIGDQRLRVCSGIDLPSGVTTG
jgi:pSer/pThr/pTyr-binding forkhead associated (FHA) protein